MRHLSTLREEEALLLRVIELSREIKIVGPDGSMTGYTLDTSAHSARLAEVGREIYLALEEKRKSDDRDWYSNH